MIDMVLHHAQSGVTGAVDSEIVTKFGKAMVRILDQWFMAEELGPPPGDTGE